MTMTGVFILGIIVSAFAIFGVVLAWGEYQTRHLIQGLRQNPQNMRKPETVVRMRYDEVAKLGQKSDLTEAA
jgi:hypothetical protein